MSFAFAGFCMSLKNIVRAVRISGAPIRHSGRKTCPCGTGVEPRLANVVTGLLHELLLRQSGRTGFLLRIGRMGEGNVDVTDGGGEFRVSEASSTTGVSRIVEGAASSDGGGVGVPIDILASLLPGFVATRGRAPLFDDPDFVEKRDRSWPHAGQAGVFIGLYVSHCPQAIPISNSMRRRPKVAPGRGGC